jgi:hypothetical protein
LRVRFGGKKKTTDGVGTFDGSRKNAPKRFVDRPLKIAGTGNNVLEFVAAIAFLLRRAET